MVEFLFWLYLLNLTLLILHEMDSAYWKEWDLFRLPGGVGGFLLIHLPLWIAGLYGLVLVREAALAGLILSLVVSLGGIFAFGIHTYFLKKGRQEFNPPVSKAILWALLILSLGQAVVTILVWR
ncbi:MAG: hypothetical protein Q8M58_03475 [Anaerolineales bacterium]|nr:hypothetical protein [Anaerolineales bacterium]